MVNRKPLDWESFIRRHQHCPRWYRIVGAVAECAAGQRSGARHRRPAGHHRRRDVRRRQPLRTDPVPHRARRGMHTRVGAAYAAVRRPSAAARRSVRAPGGGARVSALPGSAVAAARGRARGGGRPLDAIATARGVRAADRPAAGLTRSAPAGSAPAGDIRGYATRLRTGAQRVAGSVAVGAGCRCPRRPSAVHRSTAAADAAGEASGEQPAGAPVG
eukprot:ctg_311.g225